MFTFSLCMIVKNESAVLSRCLDSFAPLFEELVIVDTGSDDNTKDIALRYTDRVFDYVWQDDFSAARNFAFSKCSCDYIYSCDADEVLDSENLHRFALLKEAMLPEIEIVQMKYKEEEKDSSVLNFKSELRPKLFKRLRQFTWIDPVHETIRLDPVVFDSDIEILHMPTGGHHSKRDFHIFQKAFKNSLPFSDNMYSMYARELYKHGLQEDLYDALSLFEDRISQPQIEADSYLIAASVLCRLYRMRGDEVSLLKLALNTIELIPCCAEMEYELGLYYKAAGEYTRAVFHFNKAAFESEALLDVHTGGDLPLYRLSECCAAMGDQKEAAGLLQSAQRWQLPEGD